MVTVSGMPACKVEYYLLDEQNDLVLKREETFTGDTFTAVLAAGMARGDAIEIAAARAARFVCRCIEATADAGTPSREGVQFERCLHLLTEGTL